MGFTPISARQRFIEARDLTSRVFPAQHWGAHFCCRSFCSSQDIFCCCSGVLSAFPVPAGFSILGSQNGRTEGTSCGPGHGEPCQTPLQRAAGALPHGIVGGARHGQRCGLREMGAAQERGQFHGAVPLVISQARRTRPGACLLHRGSRPRLQPCFLGRGLVQRVEGAALHDLDLAPASPLQENVAGSDRCPRSRQTSCTSCQNQDSRLNFADV